MRDGHFNYYTGGMVLKHLEPEHAGGRVWIGDCRSGGEFRL
jgi:hypothetical protein